MLSISVQLNTHNGNESELKKMCIRTHALKGLGSCHDNPTRKKMHSNNWKKTVDGKFISWGMKQNATFFLLVSRSFYAYMHAFKMRVRLCFTTIHIFVLLIVCIFAHICSVSTSFSPHSLGLMQWTFFAMCLSCSRTFTFQMISFISFGRL